MNKRPDIQSSAQAALHSNQSRALSLSLDLPGRDTAVVALVPLVFVRFVLRNGGPARTFAEESSHVEVSIVGGNIYAGRP